ncbi:unnamed protein product [Durusdinium trenchii]
MWSKLKLGAAGAAAEKGARYIGHGVLEPWPLTGTLWVGNAAVVVEKVVEAGTRQVPADGDMSVRPDVQQKTPAEMATRRFSRPKPFVVKKVKNVLDPRSSEVQRRTD